MGKTLTVGQKLYDYNLKEFTIKKVGRIYFEIEHNRNRFFVHGLHKESEYGTGEQLYLTIQEVKDKKEHAELIGYSKKYLNNDGYCLTLDQLRKIRSILNE
jgi:hypothetical protein